MTLTRFDGDVNVRSNKMRFKAERGFLINNKTTCDLNVTIGGDLTSTPEATTGDDAGRVNLKYPGSSATEQSRLCFHSRVHPRDSRRKFEARSTHPWIKRRPVSKS